MPQTNSQNRYPTPVRRTVTSVPTGPDVGDTVTLRITAQVGLGREGVLLLLSDSTNVEREGHPISDREICSTLMRITTASSATEASLAPVLSATVSLVSC